VEKKSQRKTISRCKAKERGQHLSLREHSHSRKRALSAKKRNPIHQEKAVLEEKTSKTKQITSESGMKKRASDERRKKLKNSYFKEKMTP